MNIFLTFDYELFFGDQTGTVEGCMIRPSQRLMKIAEKYSAALTFFVDAGYLQQLRYFKNKFPVLEKEYELVCIQLRELNRRGHDIQLHVHPHWQDSIYDGNSWLIKTDRYKLSDFSNEEVQSMITSYKEILCECSGASVTIYRAGGLCVQPFTSIGAALRQNHILIDSSIFSGGWQQSDTHAFDFRLAPTKEFWHFDVDPVKEVSQGFFLELPVTAELISPLFYWKLYLLMRINKSKYVPLGDGMHIKDLKKTFKSFYSQTTHHASLDGYFASLLSNGIIRAEENGLKNYVVLSHPKSLANFSFDVLEKLLEEGMLKNHFLPLSQFKAF